jgi:hypothetical protein
MFLDAFDHGLKGQIIKYSIAPKATGFTNLFVQDSRVFDIYHICIKTMLVNGDGWVQGKGG